jgi:hypothetical protein
MLAHKNPLSIGPDDFSIWTNLNQEVKIPRAEKGITVRQPGYSVGVCPTLFINAVIGWGVEVVSGIPFPVVGQFETHKY